MAALLKGIKTLLGDVEMAPYTVIANQETHEERLYPAKKWVSSSAKSIDRESAVNTLFRRLFNYISGKNVQNIRVDMTTPVTTYIEPGASATCESTFTVAFFIPEDQQESPPDPVDPTIIIENRPELKVLTRKFGGFVKDDIIQRESKELAEILQAAGEEGIDYNHYFVVGYDPPYKPINRRNEIWFLKTISLEEKNEEDPKEINSLETHD